ncbi:hypothetical protein BDU57DRAFT_512643 [Ampelomyces quisqualis]|uniref:Uncharacterized protein n=1 Tax=Ampelomyces quisqualis TaxID=50730 RepID=A0A6A5QY57_AMPQU|nr:hypothetical protein BDU57DRAFT_512643 [Ampelomyces quisqualis]
MRAMRRQSQRRGVVGSQIGYHVEMRVTSVSVPSSASCTQAADLADSEHPYTNVYRRRHCQECTQRWVHMKLRSSVHGDRSKPAENPLVGLRVVFHSGNVEGNSKRGLLRGSGGKDHHSWMECTVFCVCGRHRKHCERGFEPSQVAR